MARPKLKPRRRSVFELLRDVAGHATTETVIMIPIFVAIWGGIWYTQQRHHKAIAMAQLTRAHVWAHAYDACEGDGGSTDIRPAPSSDAGFVGGVVDLLFGSGLIPGMRFSEIEGERSTSIQRPAVLGEGSVEMRHNLLLLCNEQIQGDRSFWSVAWGMFFG